MILIDTSVLIDYLRSPTDHALRQFEEHSAVICGVTRAEVLAGARNPADIDRIAASLDAIEQIAIAEEFWDLLGKNLPLAAGMTVPFADAKPWQSKTISNSGLAMPFHADSKCFG